MAKVPDEAKTIAIISYLTWLGLLIAFVMNNDKKYKFDEIKLRKKPKQKGKISLKAFLDRNFSILNVE